MIIYLRNILNGNTEENQNSTRRTGKEYWGLKRIKIQTNEQGRNIEAQSRIFELFSPKRYWFRRIPI